MYPKEIRSEVREIYLSESDLEGELDLRDFTYNLLGGGSKIYVSAQVDESKVIFQNKPRGVEIIKCLNAQDYINQQYPTPKEREKEKELSFGKLNNVFNKKSLEVDYLARVSRGLKELHERNLVHGDFHSGNILVHDSRILISDFGTSHLSSQENGKVFGVLPYVAPELLLGNFYTQSSDVYAFGMIAYELLTGAVPYYDEDWNNLAKKVVFDNYRPD
ncbi:11084_t:CDS:2 [Paraglomus occultum]|uniref:11084_t:CDS:1 n=1 Tax=Paraglomus occultum TaxID=144539 RepID=A0A9N9CIJ5_9GLOM|nr:11084_t:CDS:2 [Paraglomus occultum]